MNNGICYCNECGAELHYGDECIRYDGNIFCCENCLIDYVNSRSEDDIIDEHDVNNSSTTDKGGTR